MRQRKCDMGLDLGLSPYIPLPCSSPSSSSSSSSSSPSSSSSSSSSDATASKSHHHHLHHHHVAILHDGRACTFDLTELQARAILMLARRETESRDKKPPVSSKSRLDGSTYYMWSPKGVSMKRSLQRFLQGRRSRRERAQEISPYNNRITTSTATANNHHRHHRTDNDNQN